MSIYTEVINLFQNIQSNKTIPSDCFAIQFVNKGSDTVTINGSLELTQNQSESITAQPGCLDTTQYEIAFAFAAGETQNLSIIRQVPRQMRKN